MHSPGMQECLLYKTERTRRYRVRLNCLYIQVLALYLCYVSVFFKYLNLALLLAWYLTT